jgi:hypothetical protein
MGVKEARRMFRLVAISLIMIALGTILLSSFVDTNPEGQSYTGQFFLNPVEILTAFVISLFAIGVILLRSGISKRTK